jgi:hypothetical protein
MSILKCVFNFEITVKKKSALFLFPNTLPDYNSLLFVHGDSMVFGRVWWWITQSLLSL